MNKPNPVYLILTSLIALIAVLGLIRLGFWQLDRLESRREFNAHYLQQLSLPELDLNQDVEGVVLEESEYRSATATGSYEFQNEVFLQNQAYEDQPGYRVLTPFVMQTSDEILYVDRGWISMDDIQRIDEIDAQSSDVLQVTGVIRLGQKENSYGIDPDQGKDPSEKFWMIVNLERLQQREQRPVLPVYLQLTENSEHDLPIPVPNVIEITEGPHLGYAIQWFLFAAIGAFGFPILLKRTATKSHIQKELVDDDY